ncbi:heparinase II/III family protein [Psychrobacter sp. Rd 27.2]|uniref:heparinase II/III domain-containing protein n=1 Tax=Psychrobacter sp. Rd 27.2 TaxID=1926479 RepID=UPI000946C611|nr:heparinase II/III family protein [Psychrobacter sp. Rd 27.2]OLF41157.1 hypothetical protein BTV99_05765 [Psychrobacter sp. Rd 27.2]
MIKVSADENFDYYLNNSLSELFIKLRVPSSKYSYACYFYADNAIYKFHYQDSPVFKLSYNLESLKSLKIRFFFHERSTAKRSSVSLDLSSSIDAILNYAEMSKNELMDQLWKTELDYILDSETFIERGRLLVESNQLQLSGFDAVNWSSWDEWEHDPFNNRSWQWTLHWFEFIKGLMAYHYRTGDLTALEEVKRALTSWMNTYSMSYDGSFEFILHDHATALRSEQVLLFIYYLQSYNTEWLDANITFINQLVNLLIEVGHKLSEESFYSKHTNHGLEQVRMLLTLSVVFKNHSWQDLALTRLKSELDFSFTDEGVHKENSPGYHQFVFKLFISIFRKLPKSVLGNLEVDFRDRASHSLEFLTYILRPDRNLPIIGDTQLKPTTDGYRDFFKGSIYYQHFLYAFSQGHRGTAPVENNIVFPKSGYAIFRSGWGNKNNFANSIHIVFKAGCLSRYHHQQDENNFVLYGYGEDWLIDSGLYNYIDNDPIRHYARRRQAHNIPVISNTNYELDFNHRMENWKIYDYSITNDKAHVSARNTVLKHIEQKRTLEFNNIEKEITIHDSVICLDESDREVRLLLHIPKDKKVVLTDKGFEILSTKQDRKLLITLSSQPDLMEVKSGVVNGNVYSIVSNTVNTYEDSQVIIMAFYDTDSVNMKMRMRFL